MVLQNLKKQLYKERYFILELVLIYFFKQNQPKLLLILWLIYVKNLKKQIFCLI